MTSLDELLKEKAKSMGKKILPIFEPDEDLNYHVDKVLEEYFPVRCPPVLM